MQELRVYEENIKPGFKYRSKAAKWIIILKQRFILLGIEFDTALRFDWLKYKQ